jgi:uncharacterized protein YyaL (SSP411 family)
MGYKARMSHKNLSHKNRLAAETSPYLQQHADNPVDWMPWGAEALARARSENKPILLSIGYSACHWCHVMAHESFEDPATAEIMNKLYINIKVDREERPDLDKIYQLAQYAITQRSGGWPLTMFLTPDQVPVFGGTYFPPQPRYGLPSFQDVLNRVASYIKENPGELRQQSEAMLRFLHNLQHTQRRAEREPGEQLFDAANTRLLELFDEENGGFGGAPKFPHPASLSYALRQTQDSRLPQPVRDSLLHLVNHSLTCMARGGVYDQLGGGFFRYSVDQRWLIPHFEKMLYDNAQLLDVYVSAWQAGHSSLFERVVTETADWLLRDMQSPAGGYYSTLDADSEGGEGDYYVWTPDQLRSVLDREVFEFCITLWGLDGPANFEHRWHLHIAQPELLQSADTALLQKLHTGRAALLAERGKRAPPGRDEKILTGWNALTIRAMLRAGRVFSRSDWLESAERALMFIRTALWDGQRLHAVHKDGKTRFDAYLDDYAFLLDAILQALQYRWRSEDLQWAEALAGILLERFQDAQDGAFFFTAIDHEQLIFRPKSAGDDATPSGAAVAVRALQQLGHLTGNRRYLEAAERALLAAAGEMEAAPAEHCTFLQSFAEYRLPPAQAILRGPSAALTAWQTQLSQHYLSGITVYAADSAQRNLPETLALPLPDKAAQGDTVLAYVCHAGRCAPAVSDVPALLAALREQ